MAMKSAISMSSIGHGCTANQTTACGIDCGSVFWIWRAFGGSFAGASACRRPRRCLRMVGELWQAVSAYLYEVFVVKFDWWVVLGLLAQALFSMRFLVQWIASERARKSVVPVTFWWFSLGGGFLLFLYALYRKDPVFIAGQGAGLFIYLRNLQFVFRERRQDATA